jgi:rhamnosyltransferase
VISVLIPVKDGGTTVLRVVEAVQRQAIDDELEVIVVDSGSTDGSPDAIRRLGANVHEIPPESFSHGGTRNLLWRLGQGDVAVFLTDDAEPADERWLASLVDALRSTPGAAAAYGRQVARDDASPSEQYFLDFLYGPEPRVQRAAGADELTLRTTLLSNVNAAYHRSALEEFPFAESLRWAEDQDFARRALLAGKSIVYEPRAVVLHSHAYTIRTAFNRFFDSGMGADRTYLSGGRAARRELGSSAYRYAAGELRWLWEEGRAAEIPYAIVYELSKLAGMELGIHHRLLPEGIKSRLGVKAHPRRPRG